MPKITGGDLPRDEIQAYRQYVEEHHPGHVLTSIRLDGEDVVLGFEAIPFDRIRRITGYLTGTTDRWNNAKKSELADRVTHGMGGIERL